MFCSVLQILSFHASVYWWIGIVKCSRKRTKLENMNCWFPEIPFTLNLCNLSIKGFTISKQRRRSTVTLGEKSLFLYILCLSYPFLRKPVDIITNFTNQRRVSTDIIDQWEERYLLVIENDVRSPDVVAGHVQHLHPYKINKK